MARSGMRIKANSDVESQKPFILPMRPARDKPAVFTKMLEQGIAALHLDARQQGVEVPAELRGRSWLVLNYSYRFNIDDFCSDDDCVQASLSFSGVRFACRVPWDAVFAISDANSEVVRVWERDAPLELRAVLMPDSRDTEGQDVGELERPATRPAGLRVIDGGVGESASPPAQKRSAASHLVRVK